MKIMITGVDGFVGGAIFEKFNLYRNFMIFAPSFRQLDLRSEVEVRKYIKRTKPDLIIHSATTPTIVKGYPENVCDQNMRMFYNLISSIDKSVKFINLGSGSEYSRAFWTPDMSENYFGKNIPYDTHSFSKFSITKYILDSMNSNLISILIFGVYGVGEDYRYKFISNCITKNLMKLPIIINRDAIYHYLHIDDLFKILIKFIDAWPVSKIINVTPDDKIKLTDIANIVNSISEYRVDIIVNNNGFGVEYTGSNEALKIEIGKYKFIEYCQGIKNLYDFYHKNIDKIVINELINDDFLAYAKSLNNE